MLAWHTLLHQQARSGGVCILKHIEMMEKKCYFTFGCGIDTPHRNCYHVEVAEDYGKARERMVEKFGTNWAFHYTEEEWLIKYEDYLKFLGTERCFTPWYEGFTQAEMFNLKEI